MLENQEQLLPDATENQKAEQKNVIADMSYNIEKIEVQENPNDLNSELEIATLEEEISSTELIGKNTLENTEAEKEKLEVPKKKKSETSSKKTNIKEDISVEVLPEIKEESNGLQLDSNLDNSENTEPVKIEESENVSLANEKQFEIGIITEEHFDELPMIDYEGDMDIEKIVSTLQSLINNQPVQTIGKHVEELKRLFNIKFGALLKEAKSKFLEENGDPSDFHYQNPIQKEYNEILLAYKKLRQQYYSQIEKNNLSNLELKIAIIEELKNLIENGNPDTMYKNFREIQLKWRSVGPVPRDNYADTWRTYHFHVERFYDLLHLSNELRDMDFKHNYEEKLKLVQRVEVLAESDDVKAAFEELQILHRIWKEEIGPVSREHRDEIWNRFSDATNKIHNRRHEYFEIVKGEFEENLKKKEEILDVLEKINNSEKKSHNDWQKSLREVEKFRKLFIEIGRVPRTKDKEIWERFREINRIYNQAKNDYYKEIKKNQQENLDKKMKLVLQAEALRDSEDWENSTEIMKHIQSEWKNIGHVPKQLSDKIWNRFKEACNFYFDRLHKVQETIDEEQISVYLKKKTYLENLKTLSEKEGFKPDFEQLKSIINEWKEIGVVPAKQKYIDVKFNKFLDPYFDNLSSDKSQSLLVRYKNTIDSYMEQKDTNKIYDEIQFVRKKLENVTKEKQQMETNRLYFSNVDDDNPVIRKIMNEIEKLTLEIEVWESKLQYLRTLDI